MHPALRPNRVSPQPVIERASKVRYPHDCYQQPGSPHALCVANASEHLLHGVQRAVHGQRVCDVSSSSVAELVHRAAVPNATSRRIHILLPPSVPLFSTRIGHILQSVKLRVVLQRQRDLAHSFVLQSRCLQTAPQHKSVQRTSAWAASAHSSCSKGPFCRRDWTTRWSSSCCMGP
jgi:hypothetical protein